MNTNLTSRQVLAVVLVGGLFGLMGCAKQATNPVTISSSGFSTTGAAARYGLDSMGLYTINPDTMALATVNNFSFCVARVKLEDESGNAKLPDDATEKSKAAEGAIAGADSDDLRFAPGLIDVGTGAAKDWGSVTIPVGFKVSRIKIKVRKDKTLCGVDYSVMFNGVSTDKDVEFKWKFNPALDLSTGTKALQLSFSDVVAALRSAADAGALANLKSYVEGVEGSASKKE